MWEEDKRMRILSEDEVDNLRRFPISGKRKNPFSDHSVLDDNMNKVLNTNDIIKSVVGEPTARDSETTIWVMGNGEYTYISEMGDDHLHNTILFLFRAIQDGKYRVGGNTGLIALMNVMEDERVHRNLHLPLLPFKSLDYIRKGN